MSRTEDYAAHFREQLDLAVADRLRDVDTKAAVLMSGGMDSTSVAALASLQVGSSRLRAFSYRFDRHRRSDEGPFIEAMASTFGLRVENLAAESFPFFGDPEQLSIDLETPFRGWEPPLSYVLQRMRAAGHRVLLTGHGGDNAPRGSAHLYADELLRRPWRTLGQIRGHSRDFAIPVSRLLRVCVVSPWLRSLPRQELWRRLGRREPKLPKWIATDFARRTDLRRRIVESSPAFGVRGHARCQVVSLVSPWGPVARAVSAYDRLVCHYRVEARHPFLDRRVVEAAICTPPDQLFHRGRFKVLVRRAVPELPTSVRERHWKTSFRPYFDAALRHESWIEDMLSRPLLSARLGFVEPKRLRRSLQEFLQTEKSEGHPSFAVTLELWLRQLAAVAGAIF